MRIKAEEAEYVLVPPGQRQVSLSVKGQSRRGSPSQTQRQKSRVCYLLYLSREGGP